MKEKLLAATSNHILALNALARQVKASPGNQISSHAILDAVKAAATEWFDVVQPALQSAGFAISVLDDFSKRFETLLRLSRIRPSKRNVTAAVAESLKSYREQIVHQIEIGSFSSKAALSIAPFIEGLSVDEGEYLAEAQRCLTVDALRGCIVLGWCATIARIHSKIEEYGFDKFSHATVEMAGKTTGRFKPFKNKVQVDSRSELQRVFDTDLLWILEYMQLIDGNQHQRLRHCFEFRNNSSHPGLAVIKPANLYSFYSDISEIVLKNPKFAIASAE